MTINEIMLPLDMKKPDIGQQYDKIATWWNRYHLNSGYGVAQVQRALAFTSGPGKALDIGCGSGGRLIKCLTESKLNVTGIDASAEMITLARQNHPKSSFIQANICDWTTDNHFDFILAWDSLFHLPLGKQKPILTKLCNMLSPGGILIHSFGNDIGEHKDRWKDQEFYYSSIGIYENIDILRDNGLTLLHLELDQYPEKHVYAISKKRL